MSGIFPLFFPRLGMTMQRKREMGEDKFQEVGNTQKRYYDQLSASPWKAISNFRTELWGWEDFYE